MKNIIPTSEDRGQVGIGTLIVFIAMVLVAAIAAGVLVNTAGFLQATAEDAGQQSVEKVTNRVEVLNTHGVVGNDSNIKTLNLTVRLAAGSSAVDMNDTTVKYMSEDTVANLNNDSAASGNLVSNFTLVQLTDDDTSFGVLNSPTDRYAVEINASQIEDDSTTAGWDKGLDTGETVRLEITSRNGGKTQVILTMPQQLAAASNDDPIGL